jgi:hypothetical protein
MGTEERVSRCEGEEGQAKSPAALGMGGTLLLQHAALRVRYS